MNEEEIVNRFLNMIATEYNGDLATQFKNQYILKDKEIERLKIDYQQANDIIVEQSKEIENLTNDLEREKSQVKEYGTRLLKAIEYIDRRDIEWGSEEHKKLLDIFKGDDKDGKN